MNEMNEEQDDFDPKAKRGWWFSVIFLIIRSISEILS